MNLTNRREWGKLSPSTSFESQQRSCKDIGQNFITILQLLTLSFENSVTLTVPASQARQGRNEFYLISATQQLGEVIQLYRCN